MLQSLYLGTACSGYCMFFRSALQEVTYMSCLMSSEERFGPVPNRMVFYHEVIFDISEMTA